MNTIEKTTPRTFMAAMKRCLLPVRVTLLAILMLMAQSCFAEPTQSGGFVEKPSTLSVSGSATIQVVPDEVRFTLSVEARAKTVSAAYALVEKRVQQVLAGLKELDIPDHQIQAMNLSLQPVIDYKKQQQIIAHDARRQVVVLVDDISLYGRAIDKLASIESIQFQGTQLLSSQQKQLEQEALSAAFRNAKSKASVLAESSGHSLKRLLRLQEHGASLRPVAYESDVLRASSAASATTSAGTISISASVSTEWELASEQ